MVSRENYNQNILQWIHTPIIKVITGMRRSGKTYFLRSIQKTLQEKFNVPEKNILFINKEDFFFDFIRTATDLVKYIDKESQNISGKIYICIDEVQEIKQWEKAIRHYNAKQKQFEIFITGSNASLLSGELATFLTGRYITFPIYPLTFKEFLVFRGTATENHETEFIHFMKYGGLPGIHSFELNNEMVKNYLQGVFHSILFKDIILRYQLRNPEIITNFFHFLSDNIGNITSHTSIKNMFDREKSKVSLGTIKEYMHYFTDAFLTNKVKRYDIKGKKILEMYEKYYLEDLGLRSLFLGFENRDTGRIIENIVYLELKTRGYEINIGKWYDLEIDFIAKNEDHTLYIQVAYDVAYDVTNAQTKEREIKSLTKIPTGGIPLILSMSQFEGKNIQGIPHEYLIDWLLEK